MIKVTAIEFENIKGKKLKYLKFEKEGNDTLIINVGDSTYEAIKKMSEEPSKKEDDETTSETKNDTTEGTSEGAKLFVEDGSKVGGQGNRRGTK